jgi:hypothetical protein
VCSFFALNIEAIRSSRMLVTATRPHGVTTQQTTTDMMTYPVYLFLFYCSSKNKRFCNACRLITTVQDLRNVRDRLLTSNVQIDFIFCFITLHNSDSFHHVLSRNKSTRLIVNAFIDETFSLLRKQGTV